MIRFTFEMPDALPSALVALMLTCAGVRAAGAVYKPVPDILPAAAFDELTEAIDQVTAWLALPLTIAVNCCCWEASKLMFCRSEEHTSELQSRRDLVCR